MLVSPSQRALRTAALAGLADWTEDADLREWNYGGYEGVTTAEIHRARPDRNLWTEGTPATPHGRPGESPGTVAARADRVLVRVAESLRAADSADVVLVAHGHLLRVLTARYLGLPPAAGGLFILDTGALSRMGSEHGRPALMAWNVTDASTGASEHGSWRRGAADPVCRCRDRRDRRVRSRQNLWSLRDAMPGLGSLESLSCERASSDLRFRSLLSSSTEE